MLTSAHRNGVLLRLPTPAALLRLRRHRLREGDALAAARRRRLQGVDGAVGAAQAGAQGASLLEKMAETFNFFSQIQQSVWLIS